MDTLQQLLAFYGTTLSSVLDHLANRDTLFLRYLSTNLSNIAAQEGVGYRLRNLRKALAYTPKQMADAVGLPGSADQIESWEQERTVLAPSLLAHIATQLGVSSCWLIFGTPLKA
ncbi:MAG: helix-turn-helix transcriptional regulator [Agitococcus sp.]|nr:helix-turn-helix transcriptional regulator [Agitococcus sp.]MDO9179176.1 helix-turn-helix transcriptional regulator [Agitococcus sp.]